MADQPAASPASTASTVSYSDRTPACDEPCEDLLPVHRPLDPSSSPEEQAKSLAQPEKVPEPGRLHLTMIVIGKVDHTSARVLVEVLEGGEVTCQLRCTQRNVRAKHRLADGTSDQEKPTQSKLPPDDPGYRLFECTRRLPPGKPRIFKFTGLEPDARYEVSIKDLAHLQPASQFRTMMEDWRITPDMPAMRFAAVSCNLLSETLALKENQVDLWADLALRVQRDEVDCLLHMGDQVYADEMRSDDEVAAPASAFAPISHAAKGKGLDTLHPEEQLVFRRAFALLKDKDRAEWPKYADEVEGYYRQLYRETWGHRGTAVVLANVPNLTIYDDHDFVDNWGSKPHRRDKDPASLDFFIGLRARQVYWEYQGSLVRDIDLTQVESVTKDHHMHAWGEYGVIFTECRGAGSFRYDKDEPAPYMGSEQWRDIEEAMSPGGMMSRVKHLLIVCPCPVVYLPHALNGLMEPMVEDALGHWASAPFRAEQTRMLNLALAWQEGAGFGDKLKALEPPPRPKDGPITKDLEKDLGLHQTLFPSLAGEANTAAAEAAEGNNTGSSSSGSNGTDGVDDEKKTAAASTPPTSARQLASVPSPCVSDRRVTFVGGDVHVGGHTRLFKHGHLVLDQLVSSAISNHVLPAVAFKIGELVQNSYTQLEDGWSFEHAGFTRHRNYGLIDTIRPKQGEKGGKPQVVTSIVFAE